MIRLPDKEMFRVDEVARILQCSRRTVYYHIEWERLEAVRVGQKSLRVPRAAIERFIQARLVGPCDTWMEQ